MGRLKVWGSHRGGSLFSGGKYKKLLEEYGGPGTKDYTRLLLQESLPDYLSYACRECGHVQQLQDDELNTIVGHAFRLAYTSHLQKSTNVIPKHKFGNKAHTSQHLSSGTVGSREILTHKSKTYTKQHLKYGNSISSEISSSPVLESEHAWGSDRIQTPVTSSKTILPSLHEQDHHHQHFIAQDIVKSQTELKNTKRQGDKSLIKKISVNLENNLSFSEENGTESNLEKYDDCQPLVTISSSKPSTSSPPWRPACHQKEHINSSHVASTIPTSTSKISAAMLGYVNDNISDAKSAKFTSEAQCSDQNSGCSHLSDDAKLRRISQISESSSESSNITTLEFFPSSLESGTPPPLPDRMDSLTPPDEPHLRSAAWFQAGIPREIALEVLNREPVGAFMVRESTSKPGCYALSLRVPREFTLTGIAHYLIVKNSNGYRIKGFTKEFATLAALITHHSVMPELLPCPLSLSRYKPNTNNGHINEADQNDDDPDYNTLSDFRKIMADLNV